MAPAPSVLTIYHAIVCHAMRIGIQRKLGEGGTLDEADYLRMQGVCFEAYFDLYEISDKTYGDSVLQRIIKTLMLRCHPDKLAQNSSSDIDHHQQGSSFRAYYASIAMTSFLNHMNLWLETTNINANSVDTGVDILEMPLLLLTKFEPNSASLGCLPSHFEVLASVLYASTSLPSAAVHRSNLENTKELGVKARYAEACYWERANMQTTTLCTTHLVYIPRPDTTGIPDISNTGSFYSGGIPSAAAIPEDQKEVRNIINRIKTNDKSLSHIQLVGQNLGGMFGANVHNLINLVESMEKSQCQIQSIHIHCTMVSAEGLSRLWLYLANNTTVTSISVRGVFAFNSHLKNLCTMIRKNTTIESLALQGCSSAVSSYAMEDHLADALQHNHSLKRINFNYCLELYSEGVTHLAQALKHNENLEQLLLVSTGLTSRAIEPLVALIDDHPNLKHLDVRRNHFRETGINALKEAAKRSSSMEELLVDPSPIQED